MDTLEIQISPEYFGPLLPYVEDKEITDIDCSGADVWVTDIYNNCRKADVVLDKMFREQFCNRIANLVSLPFNPGNPILEAETADLRISIGHEEIVKSGRSICIRKSYPEVRFSPEEAVASGYLSEKVLQLLINSVHANMRIVVCGQTGAGKTELVKFLLQFIPKEERVLTIEDNLELHYGQINPGSNHVEIKVGDNFTYLDAIGFSLRQHPRRILLSEARGEEIKDLITAWSTGHGGFSTLHSDSVRDIPDRALNMAPKGADTEHLLLDIYNYVDIGILVRIKEKDGKRCRVIDQVCVFDREQHQNRILMLVEDGELVCETLPEKILSKFKRNGIMQPWVCQYKKEVKDEGKR